MRLVVAMTGATGAVIGIRLLEALRDLEVETHLVVSRWARATIALETDRTAREVSALATATHGPQDQAAPISSGSFPTDGMVVVPCSMKTLAVVRTGYGDGLIARAGDVTLKEARKLVIVPPGTAAVARPPGEHARPFPGGHRDRPAAARLLHSSVHSRGCSRAHSRACARPIRPALGRPGNRDSPR